MCTKVYVFNAQTTFNPSFVIMLRPTVLDIYTVLIISIHHRNHLTAISSRVATVLSREVITVGSLPPPVCTEYRLYSTVRGLQRVLGNPYLSGS